MPQHGDYNGWCRVQGIPLRSDECLECLRVKVADLQKRVRNQRAAYDRIQRVGQSLLAETKTLRAIVKRLRSGWVAGDDSKWRMIADDLPMALDIEPMTDEERKMMEAIDG